MRFANFWVGLLLVAQPALAESAGETQKAFLAAFGHAAPYAIMASGAAAKKPTKFIYTPGALVDVAPGMVALISNGKGDCDTCSGTLAIHYLKRTGKDYSLIKAWPVIGTGQSVSWTSRPNLEGGPAILASHDEGAENCRQTVSQLIALTPDRPVMRANLLMMVNYAPPPDPDRSPGYAVKAKIVAVEKGKSFALQYAGTWSLRVDYDRKGDVYAPRQREAPGC
jgi:hypothetical protein